MTFKQMICEFIYFKHLMGKGSVYQFDYIDGQWWYIVTCLRCGKISLMNRHTLDTTVLNDNQDTPNGTT